MVEGVVYADCVWRPERGEPVSLKSVCCFRKRSVITYDPRTHSRFGGHYVLRTVVSKEHMFNARYFIK